MGWTFLRISRTCFPKFNPTTYPPPDWWRRSQEKAVPCDRVDWGHGACFSAANSVYNAELKCFGNPPLAESQPHYQAGHYTVDKLMGELGMTKVNLRKTTRELARYKLQGKDAPLILCDGTPREAWLPCLFLQIKGC